MDWVREEGVSGGIMSMNGMSLSGGSGLEGSALDARGRTPANCADQVALDLWEKELVVRQHVLVFAAGKKATLQLITRRNVGMAHDQVDLHPIAEGVAAARSLSGQQAQDIDKQAGRRFRWKDGDGVAANTLSQAEPGGEVTTQRDARAQRIELECPVAEHPHPPRPRIARNDFGG